MAHAHPRNLTRPTHLQRLHKRQRRLELELTEAWAELHAARERAAYLEYRLLEIARERQQSDGPRDELDLAMTEALSG